jgi:predicted RNA-binding Zn ribbon-like protein
VEPISELPFVAGNVALDFVNTAEQRGHPDAGEALHTAEDLAAWGRRYGLLSEASSGTDDRDEFGRAIDARELLYTLFLARAHAGSISPADLERLAELAAAAYHEGQLAPQPDGTLSWSWSPAQPATVRHVAVTAAVELLGMGPAARLKQCPGEHCGWFFLDATKRGNRRWCSMRECGQDAKSARRRARTVPARPAGR